jgi:methionyl-tRNA formyltransferase
LKQKRKTSIIFFGCYPISLVVLKKLVFDTSLELKLVVTLPQQSQKYPKFKNYVSDWVYRFYPNLPMAFPFSSEEIFSQIKINGITKVDLIYCFGYPFKIPNNVLNMAGVEALNIHPSLLPEYRGADPIIRAVLNGDLETGITIHRLVEQWDAGPIFSQKVVPIPENIYIDDLTYILSTEAAHLATKEIPNILNGKQPIAQNVERASWAPSLKQEERWFSVGHSIDSISRLIRATYPRKPAMITHDGETLEVGPILDMNVYQPFDRSIKLEDDVMIVQNETGILRLKYTKQNKTHKPGSTARVNREDESVLPVYHGEND